MSPKVSHGKTINSWKHLLSLSSLEYGKCRVLFRNWKHNTASIYNILIVESIQNWSLVFPSSHNLYVKNSLASVSILICRDAPMACSIWSGALHQMGGHLPCWREHFSTLLLPLSKVLWTAILWLKKLMKPSIRDDQTFEHFNKADKATEGVIGISGTGTARDRWSMTYHKWVKLSRYSKQMFSVIIISEK